MKKIVLTLLILISLGVTQAGFSQEISPEGEKVLEAAELLFKSMKDHNAVVK